MKEFTSTSWCKSALLRSWCIELFLASDDGQAWFSCSKICTFSCPSLDNIHPRELLYCKTGTNLWMLNKFEGWANFELYPLKLFKAS